MLLAHGLGARADLPVPLWVALYAGALAVVVSFVALTLLWTEPKLTGAKAGRPLPAFAQSLADSAAVRALLKAAGLAVLGLLLAAAWLGTDDSATNPVSTWFYVWFWVGLLPLSLLAGPVYRAANPLRTLGTALHRVLGGRRSPGWAASAGYWPAVVSLLAFLWLELVYHASDSPRAIAVFLTVYTAVHVALGAVAGPSWYDRGEGFEVYFTVMARLAPVGRRADGRLVLRSPLDGLVAQPGTGLTPVLLVVLGSTTFDGVTRLPLWTDVTEGRGAGAAAAVGTLGLLGSIAAVAALYAGAMWQTRPYARKQPGGGAVDLYGAFAHTLVPLALGYTVAHYFSFAVFQGQAGWLLAGDPFGRGWDLFGTAGGSINYTAVSTTTIAFVQVAAIIVGHVVAVASAHDRAITVLRRDYVKVGQFPTLALMVAYTAIGIALVSSV